MPVAAKAVFEVRAGIIPGTAMAEHTRRWVYTNQELEKDRETPGDQPTIFSQRLQEAHDYAMKLTNPTYLNWVSVHWMWI